MNELSHVAINVDDIPMARQFYRDTFGWDFAPWGPPGFYRIEAGAPGGPGSPPHYNNAATCCQTGRP